MTDLSPEQQRAATLLESAAKIVESIEQVAVGFRYRFRLPATAPFTVVFPPNPQIPREVFELAETALTPRGVIVDWSLWPQGDTSVDIPGALPPGADDPLTLMPQTAWFVLYPPGTPIEPQHTVGAVTL